jgi:hypothetical protein
MVRLRVIDGGRPETRADCADVPRPCPYVGCRYNTYLDVSGTGEVRFNAPGVEPDQVDPAMSCALDVADDGGASLRDVGRVLGFTRERAPQIESRARDRMRPHGAGLGVVLAKSSEREPTTSREYRRDLVEEPEPAETDAADDRERVSFFSADEDAVTAHVWRVYAQRIGVDTRSIFSREATKARARLRTSTTILFGKGSR